MRRILIVIVTLGLFAASCSSDGDSQGAPTAPSTTAAASTPASSSAPPSQTSPPDTAPPPTTVPSAADEGDPVALTLHNTVVWDDKLITDNAISFLGRYLGPSQTRTDIVFAGVAGPASDLPHLAAPRTTTSDDSPPGASDTMARTFIDDVLPAFVGDASLDEPLPFNGVDTVFLSNILISGTPVSVRWGVIEHDDDHVVIRVDEDFEHRDVQRGAQVVLVGNASGEFRVGRRNPLDAVGRIDVVFDLTDSSGVTHPVQQSWAATATPTVDTDEWSSPEPGIERFTDVLVPPPADPDVVSAAVGYGGHAWNGALTVEQTWTQFDREPAPTAVHTEFDVTSALTTEGQWLTLQVTEWTADGPTFGRSVDDDVGSEFALIVAPGGRIGHAYPQGTDAIDTRFPPPVFEPVFAEALPALPTDRISVGTSWQTWRQNEQEGTGPIYTVTALDGRHLDLEVTGEFGRYIGDRYNGYSISADIEGTLRIDRQSAVPLDINIEMRGTITFGVAGEPDPTTTKPWGSTLRLEATPETDPDPSASPDPE